eukprot:4988086-Pleurochrysis_carterae.AAC.1
MESPWENGIEPRQPCRVKCRLVTVSQGRGNDTEGTRLRKIYAPLTKCIFRQYTDIRRINYFVRIALNVTPLAKVNIEEYYSAVNRNLNIGVLYTLLVTYSCVFDLYYFYWFYANMPDTYLIRVV